MAYDFSGKKNDKLIGSNQAYLFIYSAGKDIIQNFSDSDNISIADNFNFKDAKITYAKKSIEFKFSNNDALKIKSDDTISGALNING